MADYLTKEPAPTRIDADLALLVSPGYATEHMDEAGNKITHLVPSGTVVLGFVTAAGERRDCHLSQTAARELVVALNESLAIAKTAKDRTVKRTNLVR